MSTESIESKPIPWWLLLLQGVAALLLGVLLLVNRSGTVLTMVILVGCFWLVGGIISLIRIFFTKYRPQWIWLLLSGILGILAGIFVLTHILFSTILLPQVLVIIIAVEGMVIGLAEIIRGAKNDGAWAIVLGVLDILLSLWLFFHPLAAARLIPFFLGIFGIVFGVYLLYSAFFRNRNPD